MITIYVVKTTDGKFYLSTNVQNEGYSRSSRSSLSNYFINDEKPQSTFHPAWVMCDKKPEKIHTMVSQPDSNYRFELKEDVPVSKEMIESMKKSIPREDVMKYDDDEYEWYITDDEFKTVRGFYELKSDKNPHKESLIEFELVEIAEISEIPMTADKTYNVLNEPNWNHKGIKTAKVKELVKHYVFDEVLCPSILLASKPCQIDGNDLYEIVRQYIKENINPKIAEITSDYRFCFTVKKKIALAKPYETKTEIKTARGKSYRKPRYNTRLHTTKTVEIFEMTPPKENYRNYTPLAPIKGENQQDLQNNIEAYLEELINFINEPTVECECCGGVGVVFNKNFKSE